MIRSAASIVALAVLAVATSALAAPPAPITCPADAGAWVAEQCPCDGPAPTHGKYVSCVVRARNLLRKSGCLTKEANGEIARCAARSTCGKAGAVLCCTYDESATCDGDPNPGDLVAEGACSDDAAKPCDAATDCVTVGAPKVTRTESACTDRGGVSIGGGSVCGGCPPLPPAP